MFAMKICVMNKYLRYFGIPHTLVILCYPFDIFPKHS
jgi:hypothetical protein